MTDEWSVQAAATVNKSEEAIQQNRETEKHFIV